MEIIYNKACELVEQADSHAAEQVEKTVFERLRQLVGYAKTYSPYFAELYRDIDLDNFTIEDLPATGKPELMEHLEEWFTDPAIKPDQLYSYLDEHGYLKGAFMGKYTALTTSGTSGRPMPMVRDSYHNIIHGALMQKRLLREVDPNLFNPALYRTAGVICTEGHVSSYLAFLRLREANKEYAHNLRAISIASEIKAMVAELNDFNPDVLTGYPSILSDLAREKIEGRLTISPKVIVCSAETLLPKNYKLLREAFDCPVLNNYCSTEGGEVAMSCSCGKLHINSDWVIVEAVDKDLCPVADGTFSDNVLVTDLTNFVQPIIRYQMSDSVCITRGRCACGSMLPVMDIVGRASDTFLLNGHQVSSLQLNALSVAINGILGRQFVQHEPDAIECRYLLAPDADREFVLQQLSEILQQYLQANNALNCRVTICEKPLIHNKKGGKVQTTLRLFDK